MGDAISAKEFEQLAQWIEEACGIKLAPEKAYLVETRLLKLMLLQGCETYGEFYEHVRASRDPALKDKIIDAMTTNETLWFRDNHPFVIFREMMLPKLAERARTGKVRIWSAASSTGQEPYSIAMSILEAARKNPAIRPEQFEIVATDISSSALTLAQAGRYDQLAISRGVPEDIKSRYFKHDGRVWLLDDAVKRMVSFRKFNLQDSTASLGRFHAVFIRYVLIYFSVTLKQQILGRIHQALDEPGYLFVGATESLRGITEAFDMQVHAGGSYFQKKKG